MLTEHQRNRREHLEIKLCTLVYESKLIRQRERLALSEHNDDHAIRTGVSTEVRVPPEESRCLRYEKLRDHRRYIVRPAARLTHLAYGFLCGVAYAAMELNCAVAPNFDQVREIALRFGGDLAAWTAWEKAAREHVGTDPVGSLKASTG